MPKLCKERAPNSHGWGWVLSREEHMLSWALGKGRVGFAVEGLVRSLQKSSRGRRREPRGTTVGMAGIEVGYAEGRALGDRPPGLALTFLLLRHPRNPEELPSSGPPSREPLSRSLHHHSNCSD